MHFGLVRRGYSKTGGAEAYLLRLAAALEGQGHSITVFGSPSWPMQERPAGGFVAIGGRGPQSFARELAGLDPTSLCDVVYSLERVPSCDFYRAGDGVHASWLERRKVLEPWWKPLWRQFDGKHRSMLRLENKLVHSPTLRGVIANSRLVADEMKRYHGLKESQVHVVHNGLPSNEILFHSAMRADARARLRLEPHEIAVAFVGTGWPRKGLPWAIEAVELCARRTGAPLRLIVAGRGNSQGLGNQRTTFLGPIRPVKPLYMAADLFILPTVYDPFSNAALEAYATGLPVLTTRANGFSEVMLSEADGQVVENGWEIPQLVDALERMLPLAHDEQARHDRVRRASQYTMDRNLLETLEILVKAGPSGSAIPEKAAVPAGTLASAPTT